MIGVYVSRYESTLKPGDGAKIGWAVGETALVCSGQDEGRRFVVQSEPRRHADLPDDEYVREGYFEDDPSRALWAKRETDLWFTPEADAERGAGAAQLARIRSSK